MNRMQVIGVIPPDDIELTFGRDFRNIDVLTVEVTEGVMITRVVLMSQIFALVGDPVENLRRITEGCIGGNA